MLPVSFITPMVLKMGGNFDVLPTIFSEQLGALDKRNDGKIVVGFYRDNGADYFSHFQRIDTNGSLIGSSYQVSDQYLTSPKYYTGIKLFNDNIISVWNDTRFDFNDVFCNVRSFSNPDSTVGISQISSEVPEEYKLYQNYPNPFNPSTNIKFDISKTSEVKLSIYDITGREVSVLVNEKLLSGSYEFTFNSIGLSSGVYIYKLSVADIQRAFFNKMILIK
jgi:hypothetical protein